MRAVRIHRQKQNEQIEIFMELRRVSSTTSHQKIRGSSLGHGAAALQLYVLLDAGQLATSGFFHAIKQLVVYGVEGVTMLDLQQIRRT